MIRIMGFDPSMNNWGIAEGFYDPSTSQIQISRGYVIQPNKQLEKTKSVRKNSQDLDHASVIAAELTLALSVWKPHALFVEVPVGSQNARAMCSYGICIGLLAYVRQQGFPFFLVTPTQVKIALCGHKTASKDAMINAAILSHPGLNVFTKQGKINKGIAEHIADSVGAIHAGICLPDFSNYISIHKGVS